MKKRVLTFVLCNLLVALGTMAQSSLGKAVDRFAKECDEQIVGKDVYRSPSGTSYAKCYTFDISNKKKDAKMLDELVQYFRKCMGDAYKYRELKAGKPVDKILRVTYGDDDEYGVDFFKNIECNHIIMMAKDSKDASKRYCYALVWYESKNRLIGNVHEIYANDPQCKKPHSADDADNTETHRIIVGNNWNGLKEVLVRQHRYVINSSDSVRNEILAEAVKGDDGHYYMVSEIKDTIRNEAEFLQRFGNLRGMLLVENDKELAKFVTISIANKILDLCKKYAYLVDQEIRDFCIVELGRMWREEKLKIPYVGNLLIVSIDYLQNPRKPGEK